ncbi:MAG: hypothetical protein LQ346_009101, partial [Caloplaca aetnensis]
MDTASASNSKGIVPAKTEKQPVYKPTLEAYDQWAPVYDTDGNFLQALDSVMMQHLLPQLTGLLPPKARVVDLGCGTGRTTTSLLHVPGIQLLGLDNSSGMLCIAMDRCSQLWASLSIDARAATLNFDHWDLLHEEMDIPPTARDADAIVTTLVLEHIPLRVFFAACSRLLGTGGVLLVTNMHPDMGRESQAGFTDPVSGEKVRP